MKISLRKRIIAFMLSVILLFSGSISGFASELLESDPMAEAAAAVVSEEATEPATEAATEATESSAAIISEEITEATEAATEEVTEAATEAVTEEATEAAAKEETVEETEEEIVEETETETVEETEEETEESEEESEEETQVLEYEDDDVKIHVEAVGADAIPEGASLKVSPITSDDAEYNKVEQQLNEKAEGEEYEIAGFLAYDITFVDKDGNKVEPNGNVRVTIDYKKATLPVDVNTEEFNELDVTVMHFEEDANGEVKGVVDMVAEENIDAQVTTTDDAEVKKAEFVTDSFSTYTVTWIYQNTERDLVAEVVDRDGNPISGVNNIVIPKKDYDNEYILEVDNEYVFGIECAPITSNPDKDSRKTYIYSKAVLTTSTFAQGKDIYSIRFHSSNQGSLFQYKESIEGAWMNVQGSYKVYLVYEEKTPLTTIATVDHQSAGITIRLNDYSKGQNDLRKIEGLWDNGKIRSNVLKPVLENGYPISTKNNIYLKDIFSEQTGDGVVSTQLVNHLFSQAVYDATGYYEYSSFKNYAYLNRSTGNFTVYNQIGTPNVGNDYLYQRGNFFPFNNIEEGKLSGKYNKYDDNGGTLSTSSPRYNEPLYLTQPDTGTSKNDNPKLSNDPNFYFGMVIEAAFIQPKDGMVEWKGTTSPMRYEFNGDDDLWVYVDNALMLDIGGIHVAHRGYIDFSTGEIGWYDGANNATQTLDTTTIKEMFKKAKIYPDGEPWGDGERADQFFDGDTFKDYTPHTFKMFYMERGDGASDLHVRFNLPTIPKGTFEVKKELTNTDKEKYANVEFAFQAFAQEVISIDSNGVEKYSQTKYVPLRSALYKGTNQKINFFDDVDFGTKDNNGNEIKYNNVFYLKPGETANFSGLQQNRKYYVVEVGVNAKEFDKVFINGAGHKEFNSNQQETGFVDSVKTSEMEVSQRPFVLYENNCSAYNKRELNIKKVMEEGQTSNETFTFKVMLENTDGKLEPYVGTYYLKDEKENYWTYVNGVLKNNGSEAVACGTTSDGLIPEVRVGYTASIMEILSGTEFSVTEVNLDSSKYLPAILKVVENTATLPTTVTTQEARGTILLGKNAEVVVKNTLKPAIKVSKTFIGLDESQIASLKDVFKIILVDSEKEKIELTLNESAVKTSEENEPITYTWELPDLVEGIYSTYESNAAVTGYDLSVMINGQSVNIENEDPVTVEFADSLREVQFKNTYEPLTMDMDLRKTTINGNDVEGSEFGLYKYQPGEGQSNPWVLVKTKEVTNKEKVPELTNLLAGRYKLVETKAPNGFSLLENDIYFEVKIDMEVELTTEDGKTIDPIQGMWELDKVNKVLSVKNDVLYELPSSGGFGIYWYMIAGVAMMILATAIQYKNRRKEVLERIDKR